MAFVLPVAATAVAAAAPAAAASATASAALMAIATNVAVNVAISAVMSAPQPQVGAGGRVSDWTLDPDAPIFFAAGRVGVAGSVVYPETFGPDKMYYGFVNVLSGAGPITSFQSFRADDEFVSFDGNGKAISSQWQNEMWMKTSLGAQPSAALTTPTGLKNNAQLPGWTSSHKLSGKAAYLWVLGENSKRTAYPTGEPKPLWVIQGLKGWDPRLDSTYPGGSGSCRLNNPATWVYIDNPILWALKWCLGLWEGPTLKGAPAHGSETDYQVGGIGARLSGIDVSAFVAAANVADANGWKTAAYPSTDDNKAEVLDSFLQAGGAIYSERAGKMSCIQRAAPRTSVVTISARDTAGPLQIDTAASRIDRINTLRPRIWSEQHRWQMTAIPEVSADSYREEDGGVRPRGIDYNYVANATQAAQLAALTIANTREGIAGTIPLKPHMQKLRPGDAFTITESDFVLDGLKCLVLNTEYDPKTGVVVITFVSETDGKYPFALGQTSEPPEPQTLEPSDPTYVSPPAPIDWEVIIPGPGDGGVQVPEFELVGAVDNATATGLLVEWAPTASGPWSQAYLGPPTVERIPITGVRSGETYYIAVTNIRGQNYSARTVYGPYTAPALVSEDTANVGGRPSSDVILDVDQLLVDADELRTDYDVVNARVDVLDSRGAGANLLKYGATYPSNALVGAYVDGWSAYADWGGGSGGGTMGVWTVADRTVEDEIPLFSQAYSPSKGGGYSVFQAAPVACEPGKFYMVSAYAASLYYSTRAAIYMYWCDDAGVPISNSATGGPDEIVRNWTFSGGPNLGQYKRIFNKAQCPVGCNKVRMVLVHEVENDTSDPCYAFFHRRMLSEVSPEQTEPPPWADAGLGTRVTRTEAVATSADGRSKAIHGVTLDVNGYVTGHSSTNDGATGEFAIVTDRFRLADPSGTSGSIYEDGIWTILDAANGRRTRYGSIFGGSNKLVWWSGPSSVPLGSEAKSNADVYISTVNDGAGPRFGGNDVSTGGGASGSAEAVGSTTANLSGSGWQSIHTFTVTGVPSSPAIQTVLSFGSANATVAAEYRLVQTTGGAVVAGPSATVSHDGGGLPAPPEAIGGTGTQAGSVQYRLEGRLPFGGSVTVPITIDYSARQGI